jgi:abortive infection bacteriophage resistance protein
LSCTEIFDRELRLVLLDAIERIEVSVKTQWAYYFSESHGSHAYMDCKLSNNIQWHTQNIILLEKELKRSDELFISHYQKNYTSPSMPPIWVICEIMSFGLLSRVNFR